MERFSAIKREPCQKCGEGVFLAERFCVGDHLYHRKCLKCARCGIQLSAGSFYETEIDGEFCCETCPDEEKVRIRNSDTVDGAQRASVADRVALFQRVDLELTKKALSDEEKRESLHRLAKLTLVTSTNDETSDDESSDDDEEGDNEEIRKNDKVENGNGYNPIDSSDTTSNEVPCDDELDKTEQSIEEASIQDELKDQDQEKNQDKEKDQEKDPGQEKDLNFSLDNLEISESEIREAIQEEIDKIIERAIDQVQLKLDKSSNKIIIDKENELETSEVTEQKESKEVLSQPVTPKPQPRTKKSDKVDAATDSRTVVVEKVNAKPPIKPRPVLTKKQSYPTDLNPFGDDDEEPVETSPELNSSTVSSNKEYNRSLNPFGSESEDDCVDHKKAMNSSGNPFGSESEDDSSVMTRQSSGRSNISAKRTPVPTPRRLNTSINTSNRHTLTSQNVSVHSRNMNVLSGSSLSLTFSDGSNTTPRKKKAPAPPPPPLAQLTPQKQVGYESEDSNSSRTTSGRKKRRAPPPPPNSQTPPIGQSTPIKADDSSSSEPASLVTKKIVPLSDELAADSPVKVEILTPENAVYRRKVVPLADPFEQSLEQSTSSRSSMGEESIVLNKSDKGKWKRKKHHAPAAPVQVRSSIKAMSPEDIKEELDRIEVQQAGLEKQGVTLEKMIREKCEGLEAEHVTTNPKVVEDLILSLFDVVNEKNELFRKQAELMYMRRQHRLEQEQQELDQEIRALMSRPEQNKTDSDKAREEALIARLIEVVKLRNEVVDSLESDRVREKQEDQSIRQSIEKHAAKFEKLAQKAQSKFGKKDKKKAKKDKQNMSSEEKAKKKKNVFNRFISATKSKETIAN